MPKLAVIVRSIPGMSMLAMARRIFSAVAAAQSSALPRRWPGLGAARMAEPVLDLTGDD
jgi:hypothetical protein